MNVKLDSNLIGQYHSTSQTARILTESWVADNMFCPRCGCNNIKHFENNRPVADFYCPSCMAQYELKSKKGTIEHKINDGAYDTMIKRIVSNNNPDFFFMNYSIETLTVKDFLLVPKHFFVPEIIEKRKPLSTTARRAGWTGCNILLDQIPTQGRIAIIRDGVCQPVKTITEKLNKSQKLATDNITTRGWLLDILNCVNSIQSDNFTLNDMYGFEDILQARHADNHNVKAKIRQQLQILRDKGYIEFMGKGMYKK